MVEERSLVGPWEFAVFIGVVALVGAALDKRVKDQQTALVAGVIAGIFVVVFTPAAQMAADLVSTVRAWLFG